jgi:protein-ribulosamine 3-kinase
MVSSEFQAMSTFHSVFPEMVPKPVAWGSYNRIPDTHFFMCKFRRMSGEIPEMPELPILVAEMHKRAVSPDDKFGWPYRTFGGNKAQNFPVSTSWEECFSVGMRGIFAAELETHGEEQEFQELAQSILEKVIPRLLRPLETGGRAIVPCLVHGDLWKGNMSVDVETGKPVMFDATPLYAHNECQLGCPF